MAEDIVLRLKAENEDLKRKLEESQTEVRGLRTEVEGLGQSTSEAGDAFDQAAAEMQQQFEAVNREIDDVKNSVEAYRQGTTEAGAASEIFGAKIGGALEQLRELQLGLVKGAGLMVVLRQAAQTVSDGLTTLGEVIGDESGRLKELGSDIEKLTQLGGPFRVVFEKAAESAGQFLDLTRQQPEALRSFADALDAIGLEGWAETARKAAEGTEVLIDVEKRAAQQADDLAKATERLRETLRPSDESIQTDLEALRAVYQQLTKEGGLTQEQLIKIGQEADRLLAIFNQIGQEAPADLQELADKANKAAEAKETAAKAAEALAAQEKGLAESTVEAADSQEKLATALEDQTAAAAEKAREEFEALQKTLDESVEKIGDLAQKAIDSAREAQQQAAPGQAAPGGSSDAQQQVESLKKEIADLNEEQQSGLIVTEQGTQRLTDARAELIEAEKRLKDEASDTGQVFYRSAQQAAASQQKVNDLIQGAREQVTQLQQQLDDPAQASSLQRIVDGFDSVSSSVGATGADVEAFSRNFQSELDRLRQQATASFDETAKGAEKGKEGVEKLGDAAKDASKSAEELGDSTKTAAEHAKELGDVNIERLPDSLEEADAIAQKHLATLDQIIAKWVEINALVGGV